MVGRGFPGGETVWAGVEANYLLSQYAIILIIAVFLATPVAKRGFDRVFGAGGTAAIITQYAIYLALFFLALSFMVSSRFNPFIYFNF